MPTISPARTSNDTPCNRDFMDSPRTVSITRPGIAGFLLHPQQHVAADHQAGQLGGVRLLGLPASDDAAVAHHGHLVRDRQHLGELVGDDDDRLPLLPHAAQDRKKLLHLLRREHGRRLVEDQQPRLAVERLQQLDPLLLADRQGLDRALRIDRQAELFGQRADARLGAS